MILKTLVRRAKTNAESNVEESGESSVSKILVEATIAESTMPPPPLPVPAEIDTQVCACLYDY